MYASGSELGLLDQDRYNSRGLKRKQSGLGVGGGTQRQRQADLCDFKGSLVYRASSRRERHTHHTHRRQRNTQRDRAPEERGEWSRTSGLAGGASQRAIIMEIACFVPITPHSNQISLPGCSQWRMSSGSGRLAKVGSAQQHKLNQDKPPSKERTKGTHKDYWVCSLRAVAAGSFQKCKFSLFPSRRPGPHRQLEVVLTDVSCWERMNRVGPGNRGKQQNSPSHLRYQLPIPK